MILVTGAEGFLGQHLLKEFKDEAVYPVSRKAYNLASQAHIDALFKHTQPDIIFHLATSIGGLDYNLKHPAEIYYNNTMMNTQLIHKAASLGVKKFIFVGTVCSYPKHPPYPTRENALYCGRLEESNEAYGLSKLAALTQLKAYKKQYGLQFEYPILANLFGPGDKGFTEPKKSHVIPALIQKFYEAILYGPSITSYRVDDQHQSIEVWGNGSQTRDFLFVKDAAKALKKFLEVDYGEPINIASTNSVSIATVVEHLKNIFNFQGEIVYNSSKPTGQLRRSYAIDVAKEILKWQPETSFEDGLKETVEWYLKQIEK